jgi:hypothetical protein
VPLHEAQRHRCPFVVSVLDAPLRAVAPRVPDDCYAAIVKLHRYLPNDLREIPDDVLPHLRAEAGELPKKKAAPRAQLWSVLISQDRRMRFFAIQT